MGTDWSKVMEVFTSGIVGVFLVDADPAQHQDH